MVKRNTTSPEPTSGQHISELRRSRKKSGYLGVAPVSVLSRKLVFETIGKVFRVEIPGGKKNPNVETFGTDSLERL